MSDIPVLRAMMDREVYLKYFPVLAQLKNKQRETEAILRTIKEYYDKYKSNHISVDELKVLFEHLNPHVQDKAVYNLLFDGMKNMRIDNKELLIDIMNKAVERHIMSQIDMVAKDVLLDIRPTGIDKVESLVESYKEIVGIVRDAENDVCTLGLAELLAKRNKGGMKWSLKFLNNVLGLLEFKTLGHFFARPDVGKTAMAINQLCCFAVQLRKTNSSLLYLSNEEDIERIKNRAYCCMNNQPLEWLEDNIAEAEATWDMKGGYNLKFIPGVQHINDVYRYVDAFEPKVVVIDQGPKVDIEGNAEGTERLRKVYNKYRQLASDAECAIITLGQAENSTAGKKYLYLNHLDSSKVGIPGELDWCVGIGMVYEPGYEELRYLNICKNKLTGRSGNDSVMFNINNCRYRDIKPKGES